MKFQALHRVNREKLLWFNICVVGMACIFIAGCQKPPQPYVSKATAPVKLKHCNDYTGHKTGTQPWATGGTCCCTPSPQLMDKLHADGFCRNMDADALETTYKSKGIILRGGKPVFSNGMGPSGDHVVLGGNSLIPPTPGTTYYERVITGNSGNGTVQMELTEGDQDAEKRADSPSKKTLSSDSSAMILEGGAR